MSDWYFKSINHYNVLMLQESLYRKFAQFEYILLCQTDAMVIGEVKTLLSFDYFGASWKKDFVLTEAFNRVYVNRERLLIGRKTNISAGNGGLSLRKTSSILELIRFGKSKPYWNQFERVTKRKLNEDIIFSFLGTKLGLRIPDKQEADRYFSETNPFDPNALGELIGFHALEKYQPGLEQRLFDVIGGFSFGSKT